MRLKEKVAIVTGGGRGLGREYALKLAKEGARVVVAEIDFDNARAVAKEIEDLGGEALALSTDVSSEEATQAMAMETVKRFGRIDVLVNNAALMADLGMKPFTAISVEEWDRVFSVNVRGMFLCCKAVFPQMQGQGKGKIINITSVTIFIGMPMVLHYVSSKGSVQVMTRSLAREMGDHGVNVNAIAVGFVPEAGTRSAAEMMPTLTGMMATMQCFRRTQLPKDLLGTLVFLSSEDSDFLTGQTIAVDGGMTMI